MSRRHFTFATGALTVALVLAGGTALAVNRDRDDPATSASADTQSASDTHKGSDTRAAAGPRDTENNGGSPAATPPSATAGTSTGTGAGTDTGAAPAGGTGAGTAGAMGTAGAPARFGLRAPGAALPSGAQCAAWVRTRPYPENKRVNRGPNSRVGHRIDVSRFHPDDARAGQRIAPRIDGQFTGTTREILRWAACKWGFDEDMVFAQAAVESWWRQNTFGDWTTNVVNCAPGHLLGADGRPGECPESFGIVQTRYPYMKYAWPGIGNSTAMVADLGYAVMRSCFEGYEGWLNTVERGQQYRAGDVWGCAGRYMSGRWHVAAGDQYVAKVRDYQAKRIWDTPNFQEA